MKTVFLFVALILFSAPSFAGDRTIIVRKKSDVVQNILKKLDSTDPRTFDCASIQTSVQEIICKGGLISTNRQLLTDKNELAIALGKRQALVDKAHTSWILMRNADCEIEAASFTGTMASTTYIACIITANKKRHEFMQRQLALKRG